MTTGSLDEMEIAANNLIPSYSIPGKKLSKKFYLQDALIVARELIGKILVKKNDSGLLAGIIVETEAYKGAIDAASHSYIGKTKRNEVMFEEGGACYVYFTYGNHYCINAVTQKKGVANAVLIRALEPLIGLIEMKINRGTDNIYNLASGPGKLTQAIGIDKKYNGFNLRGNEIFIVEAPEKKRIRVLKSKRIGITKNTEKLWRFYESGNPFVSRANIKTILKRQSK